MPVKIQTAIRRSDNEFWTCGILVCFLIFLVSMPVALLVLIVAERGLALIIFAVGLLGLIVFCYGAIRSNDSIPLEPPKK
jgi:hypothetical protein